MALITSRLLSCCFAAALAALAIAPSALAHHIDPLELAPTEPAVGAEVEVLSGFLHELVVDDRVANVTIRYRSLALDDGSHVRLDGTATAQLAHGSRVEVTGRRNGKTLFVSDASELARANHKQRPAGTAAEAEGVLRMYHVDYLEPGRSHMGFDVLGPNDEVTPIQLDVHPAAIQRGMRVVVRGIVGSDGALSPAVITILALPDVPVEKVAEKAIRTDNVLVILMRFNDSPATNPFTQAQVQAVMAGEPGSGSVAEYFKEVSFNQQLLNVTVTPWLSTGAATPAGCGWQTMGSLGRSAATAAGYVLSGYQKIVYVFPRVSACGWSGLGYVGGAGAWVNGSNSKLVYGHELGHNFGMLHAGRLDCGVASIGGTCSVAEYGDPFNIMGNSSSMHVNAFQKADMGWIAPTAVRTHSTGTATYTLNPIETAGGTSYAVKVPAAANRTYWLEYRKPIGFDAGLASYPHNGAFVRVATPFETMCSGCDSYSDDTQLLDMTPATSTFTDAALLAGQSFTDTKYGITFNVLSATATTLTVQVSGPGGAATTTTALTSGLNPSTSGISVTFTATVTGTSPTGSVSFTANGAPLAGCSATPLTGTGNARTALCATAALAVGSHSIVAAYNGDSANPPSTSAPLSQGVNAAPSGTNVALASSGATASASSLYGTGYPASSVINNERAGINFQAGGGWKDATPSAWPDWLEVKFSGSKRIDRVVVYSVQDAWKSPVEPTATMTGSDYPLKNFTVQGWNGTSWVTLATVSSNTLIKRTVTFAAYTTDRIRINVTSTPDGYSRITEIEAWGHAAASTTSATVASSQNPATLGVSVTLTASVTGVMPTGNVSFMDNGASIASCTAVALSGTGNTRTAACTVGTLAVGSHAIVASYAGDSGNQAATSPSLAQAINAPISTNVALASTGATASASSLYGTGYPASSVINNERAGINFQAGGGWKDATPSAWPDWLEVKFSGSKRIDRVVVYSVQDAWKSPVEPTATMTGSDYPLKNFTVQGWNGTSWVTLATVSSNTLIKRTVTFAAYTTDRIRINVTSTPDGYSRITEIEAWGY